MTTLKEKVIDLSEQLSTLNADNMIKVSMHFAKLSEAHWYEKCQGLTPGSKEHSEAAANWQKVRGLLTKLNEAMDFRGHFAPRNQEEEAA